MRVFTHHNSNKAILICQLKLYLNEFCKQAEATTRNRERPADI